MLAPLACAVVLLVSGVAKMGDPTAARDAFRPWACLGPCASAARQGPPVRRAHPRRTAARHLVVAAGRRRRRRDRALRGVLGAGPPRAAPRRARRLRVLRGAWRRPGLRTTLARNSVLVVLGALATTFGAAGSGVLPAVRDFRSTDWWWLVLSVAVAATAVLVVGCADPTRRAARTCSTTSGSSPRSPCSRTSRRPDHAAAAGRDPSAAAVLPELLVLGLRDGRRADPRWTSRLGPVEISTVFTESLADLPPAVRPGGVPVWFDVERGATETFAATGRPPPSCWGRRCARRRPGRGSGRRRGLRRGDRGGAGRRTGGRDARRAWAGRRRIDDPGNDDPGNDDHGHDHERDDGHRHEHA